MLKNETSRVKVESGLQLLARLCTRPDLGGVYPILFGEGPNINDVIEISGNSNTGKSILLSEIILNTVLPKSLEGKEAGAIVFNTNGCFDSARLVDKIVSRLQNSTEIPINVEEVLNRLHFISIHSSMQLLLSIQNLDNLLSIHNNVSLVAIDSLTAFYWSEQNSKITKMDTFIKDKLRYIQSISRQHKTTLFYIKPAYFSSKCLSTIDNDFINYRVLLSSLDPGLQSTSLYNAQVVTNKETFSKEFQILSGDIQWSDVSQLIGT